MSSVITVLDSVVSHAESDHEQAVREGGDRRHSGFMGRIFQNLCARYPFIDFAYLGFPYLSEYSGSHYSIRRE